MSLILRKTVFEFFYQVRYWSARSELISLYNDPPELTYLFNNPHELCVYDDPYLLIHSYSDINSGVGL